MMDRYTKKESLFEQNKALLDKIKHVKNQIKYLESQKSQARNPGNMIESGHNEMVFQMTNENEDEPLETAAELNKHRQATEELLGLKFISYNSKDLSGQGLPPGKWIEVTANVLIQNSFQVYIRFIENSKNTSDPVFSLNWSVQGNLEQAELESLKDNIHNDLPGLFCRLKEYAQLSQDRDNVLNDFHKKFEEYSNIQTTKNGMCLRWKGGLFMILWPIKLCTDTGCIENNFIIEVNEKERDFMIMSRGIFEELINEQQTADMRSSSLNALGMRAVQYCNQIG